MGNCIFSNQLIFNYLCTHIGSLNRTTRKAIKRECRENRQQSRCCKLYLVLNTTFATVCLQTDGKAFNTE